MIRELLRRRRDRRALAEYEHDWHVWARLGAEDSTFPAFGEWQDLRVRMILAASGHGLRRKD